MSTNFQVTVVLTKLGTYDIVKKIGILLSPISPFTSYHVDILWSSLISNSIIY